MLIAQDVSLVRDHLLKLLLGFDMGGPAARSPARERVAGDQGVRMAIAEDPAAAVEHLPVRFLGFFVLAELYGAADRASGVGRA